MKTMKQWNGSKLDFSQFAQPGDQIDDEIYFYFLGCVPPRKMTHYGFLVGEPYSHDIEQNAPTYDAFYKSPSNKYFYGGHKTINAFMNTDKKAF